MDDIQQARFEVKIEQQRRSLHAALDAVFDGLRAELCPDGPAAALRLRLISLEDELAHLRRQLREN